MTSCSTTSPPRTSSAAPRAGAAGQAAPRKARRRRGDRGAQPRARRSSTSDRRSAAGSPRSPSDAVRRTGHRRSRWPGSVNGAFRDRRDCGNPALWLAVPSTGVNRGAPHCTGTMRPRREALRPTPSSTLWHASVRQTARARACAIKARLESCAPFGWPPRFCWPLPSPASSSVGRDDLASDVAVRTRVRVAWRVPTLARPGAVPGDRLRRSVPARARVRTVEHRDRRGRGPAGHSAGVAVTRPRVASARYECRSHAPFCDRRRPRRSPPAIGRGCGRSGLFPGSRVLFVLVKVTDARRVGLLGTSPGRSKVQPVTHDPLHGRWRGSDLTRLRSSRRHGPAV